MMRRIFCLFTTLALIAALSACMSGTTRDASSKSQSDSNTSSKTIAAALSEKTGIIDLDCTTDFSTCAYVKNAETGGQLMILKDGKEDAAYKTEAGYALREPLWSPDGKYLAFKVQDLSQKEYCPYGKVFVYDLTKKSTVQTDVPICIGGSMDRNEYYRWSSDSSKLLMEYCVQPVVMGKDPQRVVYWDIVAAKLTDVSEELVMKDRAYVSGERCFSASFSPDGKKVVYSVYVNKGIFLRLFDCKTGGRTNIGKLNDGDRLSGVYVSPPVWLSDTELLAQGMQEDENGGDSPLFRVSLTAGNIEKIAVSNVVSIAPSGKHLVTLGTDGYAIWDMGAGTSTPIPDAPGKYLVWSRDSSEIIFWAGGRLGIVDLKGKPIGGIVTDRIGDSTPTFTGDGVWYEKRV